MKLSPMHHIKSIREKFIFLTLTVTLLSLFISSAIKYNFEYNSVYDNIQSDLESLVSEISLSVSDSLWQYNTNNLELISDTAIHRDIVYQIQIIDNNRGVLIDKKNPLYLLQTIRISYQEKELKKNNLSIGKIKIGVAHTPYMNDLYKRLINDVSYTLLRTTILIGFLIIVSSSITKPIKELEKNIREMSGGDYSKKIEIQGHDEVAELSKAFNLMAERIEASDTELRAINSSLEQLVVERTHELNLTNDELKEALSKSQQIQAELTLKNEILEETMKQLEVAYSELIEASKSNITNQIIASVAHEINNPIGLMVTSNSYLIQELKQINNHFENGTLRKSDLKQFLDLLTTSTNSIEKTLENTVTLVRNFKEVAVDQTSLRIRTFNVKTYFEEVLNTLTTSLKRKNITLTLQSPSDLFIESYPGAFSQIITNLTMNAIKHGFKSHDQGEITITIGIEEEQLHWRFSDNGNGIDPELLSNIFTPFFSTEHNHGGSGLGLSIVKHLIEDTLKGKMSVESEVGKGLTYDFLIPVKTQSYPI